MNTSHIVVGVIFVTLLMLLSPLCLIVGLQWMGFPIELTWKTFAGALFVCAALQGSKS